MKRILVLFLLLLFCFQCKSPTETVDSLLFGTWEFVRAKFYSSQGVPKYIMPEEYGRQITAIFKSEWVFDFEYRYPDRTNHSMGKFKTFAHDWIELDFHEGPTIKTHYHVSDDHLDFGLGEQSDYHIPLVWEFVRSDSE